MLAANTVLSLGLLGLVSAAPLDSRQVPHYPPTLTSKGFRLVANVTDPTKDLNPSVNGWTFTDIHTGAGLGDAVVRNGSDGRIFYQNGTAEEFRYHAANTLSDGGTPAYPWGIGVQDKEAADEPSVTINVGSGTKHVDLATFPSYLSANTQGTFAVCPRNVPYYNSVFNVVRYIYHSFNPETGLYESAVPDDCAAIRLLPECATLADLPPDSTASHEFAADSACYENVQAIDWTQYGP